MKRVSSSILAHPITVPESQIQSGGQSPDHAFDVLGGWLAGLRRTHLPPRLPRVRRHFYLNAYPDLKTAFGTNYIKRR